MLKVKQVLVQCVDPVESQFVFCYGDLVKTEKMICNDTYEDIYEEMPALTTMLKGIIV